MIPSAESVIVPSRFKQQIFYHFLFSLPTPAEQLLLLKRLFVFKLCLRFAGDAASDSEIVLSVFMYCCADHNIEIAVTVERQITDRAGIKIASAVLQFFNDLHRTQFRCPGDGSARKGCFQKIHNIFYLPQVFPELPIPDERPSHTSRCCTFPSL